MTETRIYLDLPLAIDKNFSMPKAASHHVCKVLRRQPGDPLTLFNGDGSNYHATLLDTAKAARIEIHGATNNATESALSIHLLQGISRTDRMDSTIQKAVELGVSEITPLLTRKGKVKLVAQRQQKKQQHWQSIVIGACEQCGRSTVPRLNAPRHVQEYLEVANDDDRTSSQALKLILHPASQLSIATFKSALVPKKIEIIIGPESGFDDAEIAACLARKFICVSSGPRILRTETAGPSVIAVLQARFGDWR